MPLYLYDYRPGNGTVGGIPRDRFETGPGGDPIVSGSSAASHMVAHLDVDQLSKLLTPHENYLNPPPNQIVLCVSFGLRPGFPRDGSYPDRVVSVGGKRRFVLFARFVEALNRPEVVAAFRSCTTEEAERIVAGEFHRLSPAIRALFDAPDRRHLKALGVLCRAYQLVLTGPAKAAPPPDGDIHTPLWWRETITGEGSASDWKAWDGFTKTLAAEWGADRPEGWKAVKALLTQIDGTEPIDEAPVTAALAALIDLLESR